MEANYKKILIAVGAVLLLVVGFFGYREFIQKPNQDKAAAALFRAESWFAVDSFNLVLNGDGQNDGALFVINKYGGTDAGNLARYYAGISYLKTGDFQNAISMLSAFNGKGTPLEYLAFGNLGDAYMEAGDIAKGIESYKKAGNNTNDAFVSPLYLYRGAVAAMMADKNDEAIALLQKIKNEFPMSTQAKEVEKLLATLGVLN